MLIFCAAYFLVSCLKLAHYKLNYDDDDVRLVSSSPNLTIQDYCNCPRLMSYLSSKRIREYKECELSISNIVTCII